VDWRLGAAAFHHISTGGLHAETHNLFAAPCGAGHAQRRAGDRRDRTIRRGCQLAADGVDRFNRSIIPAYGGFPDGSASMSVSFTDTTATATASAASVGLGPGHVFHVDTCMKAHDVGPSYSTNCQQDTVDTTAKTNSTWVPAPTATALMPRPAVGRTGYFSFIISISEKQGDNSFKPVASSWPSSGLTGASVGVPSVGASSSPAPASEGLPLTNNNNQTGGDQHWLPGFLLRGPSGSASHRG